MATPGEQSLPWFATVADALLSAPVANKSIASQTKTWNDTSRGLTGWQVTHDGWKDPALGHTRAMRLSDDGNIWEGFDRFVAKQSKAHSPIDIAARFFLHPDTDAKRDNDGTIYIWPRHNPSVGWTMKADGALVDLVETTSLNDQAEQRDRRAILLTAALTGDVTIAWRFTRSHA